ncbi:glycosyltransferase family 2 protein [Kitasatospora sp. NPDC056327]|uniref:glycosyltransferase family 2 protein n=1 Tax=Kitasatospora sp. NPDC056327 TaxID=3345785 RepID=UPI0035DF273F
MIGPFSRRAQDAEPPAPGRTAATEPVAVPEAPYNYAHFSRLAGPAVEPGSGTADGAAPTTGDGAGPYRVRYRSLLSREPHRIRAALLLLAAPLVEVVLLVWLLQPGHWPVRPGETDAWLLAGDKVMIGIIAVVEVFRLVNVVSNTHATLAARDPVPVPPERGTRVAFLTTCVPGKEPPEMVRATLAAALAVRHDGPFQVWLLDEGNDPAMRELCDGLGVRHFSRSEIDQWNTAKGRFRARTKHGNYNTWLQAYGADYDFWVSVDTDHVPLPEFCERMLGYFRDPDVAFVVGPQVYGNYRSSGSTVTRFAESQQYLFHALVQRAGNRYGAPMFVGTNNAVRIGALRAIGGLYDSVTEDMATGLEFHRHRNPATGARWKSVYTPDVLAVGEGPSSWTDFFSQQLRWSRGTYETLLTQYGRAMWGLSPGRLLNYTLMVSFYPTAALTWLLGGVSSVLYLGFGASGVHVSSEIWMALYSDAAALQMLLYTWNRKHNVSPHEPAGSSGVAGMVMSALCGPVYAASFVQALLRIRSRFVVTPKGLSASPDRVTTFRLHLFWALVFGGALAVSFRTGHDHVAMRTWAALALLLSLLPVLLLGWDAVRRRRARPVSTLALSPAGSVPAPGPVPAPAGTAAEPAGPGAAASAPAPLPAPATRG